MTIIGEVIAVVCFQALNLVILSVNVLDNSPKNYQFRLLLQQIYASTEI